MIVRFKRPWFVKGNKLFKPEKFGTEVPDSLAGCLPRDAEVLTPPAKPVRKAKAVPDPAEAAPPEEDSPDDPPEEPTTLSALAKKSAAADEETWTKAKSK